jgi:phospholipid transport system substrate-binding protein
MKSGFMLLATLLAAGGSHGVPHYGPTFGAGPGPGAGPESYMYGTVVGPQVTDPVLALRAGVDKLLAFLGAEQRPSEQALAEFLEREIVPFFDFEYMAESAGGRLFEQQGDQERQAMIEGIKTSFLSKMAEKLGGYQNQQLRYLPPRPGNDGRTAQVSVAVLNPGGYPTRLDFRLYRTDDAWKVYDVAANGQSAIVHYRNELMRQLTERRMRQMRPVRPPMGPGRPLAPRMPYGGPMG